jgi:hypothetical protein
MRRTSQLVGLDFSTERSISPLPVTASVAKARPIFMTFRELRLTRMLNYRNARSYVRVSEAPLASLGNWLSIESKEQWRLGRSFLNLKAHHFSRFRRASSLNAVIAVTTAFLPAQSQRLIMSLNKNSRSIGS